MQRIQTLDIARGFTVLMIAPIHTVMLYSNKDVQQSVLGVVFDAIAEGPGAQLFMLLMGLGFVFSRATTAITVFKRALYLLILAYLLNFLKFIVPLLFGWMPENLLAEFQLHNNTETIRFFFLLGDILHFAALAYPFLFIVYRLKHFQYWALLFSLAIILTAPLFWDLKTGNPLADYFLQLLGGHPPYAFFPMFPWLVYPVTGLSLGYFLKHSETGIIFKTTGWIGIVLLLISFCFPVTPSQNEWLPFYRTAPSDTIFHLGFVLAWLALIHLLTLKLALKKVWQLFEFCSRNITSIYVIQWIIICWLLPFVGYHVAGFNATLFWIGITTLATLLIVRLYGSATL